MQLNWNEGKNKGNAANIAGFINLENQLSMNHNNTRIPNKLQFNSRRVLIMMSDFMNYLNGEKEDEK